MAKKAKKPAWRRAVQEAMYQATLREARRRYNTEKPIFNYRWEHVEAVAQLAVNLARLTGADEEVVEAAAWLHDIRKDKKQDHPRAGAKFAREFLPTTDFPPGKIERVAIAIEDHMGLWRDEPLQNLESAVLWDADKLAKIGLTAAVHWMGMGFAAGAEPRWTSCMMARRLTGTRKRWPVCTPPLPGALPSPAWLPTISYGRHSKANCMVRTCCCTPCTASMGRATTWMSCWWRPMTALRTMARYWSRWNP